MLPPLQERIIQFTKVILLKLESYQYHVPMLKVRLKQENQEKLDDTVTHHKFVLKLLKATIFSKNVLGKRKESS